MAAIKTLTIENKLHTMGCELLPTPRCATRFMRTKLGATYSGALAGFFGDRGPSTGLGSRSAPGQAPAGLNQTAKDPQPLAMRSLPRVTTSAAACTGRACVSRGFSETHEVQGSRQAAQTCAGPGARIRLPSAIRALPRPQIAPRPVGPQQNRFCLMLRTRAFRG